ncbi:MAG: helix-turn-helix domain-containing protein [Pirellulaceae bacterium]
MAGRFYGDEQNPLLRRWCEPSFMADPPTPWPLVLYGPSGVGKSALVETLALRLGGSCLQLTGSEFRRQFLDASQTRSFPRFRQRLLQSDILLVDDLNLPASELALTREFVQILEHYLEAQRPVLVTCLTAPWTNSRLSPELRSRLSAGLVIEVRRPGPDARRAIVADVLQRLEFAVNDDDLDWLVESLPQTAPLIRQRLSRLSLAAGQLPCEVTDRVALKQMLASTDNTTTDQDGREQLVRRTARYFRLPVSALTGKTRKQEVVRARSIGMFVAREHLRLPVREIGRLFGNRDPSTVRHACRQVNAKLAQDAEMAVAVSELVEQLNADKEARLCADG